MATKHSSKKIEKNIAPEQVSIDDNKPLIPKPKIQYDPSLAAIREKELHEKVKLMENISKPKKSFWFILKDFFKLNQDKSLYVWEFAFTVIIYGILINFSLSQILHWPFNIAHTLAAGIVFYFFKEELPRIIIKSTFKRGG